MSLELAAESVPLYWAEDHQVIRVEGTRVSLDSIVYGFLHGQRPEAIALDYPRVGVARVYAVIAYYLAHREEVDAYVADRVRWGEEQRAIIESSPDSRTAAERIGALTEARRARQ